ncbi:MAG: PAS domain-containing protein, partial [Motiliproteus sp.]
MIRTTHQQWVVALTVLFLSAIWLAADYLQIESVLVTETDFPTLSPHRIIFATLLAALFSLFIYVTHIRWMPFLTKKRRVQLSLLSGLALFCTLLVSTAFFHTELRHDIASKRTAALTIAASHSDSLLSLINQSRATTTAIALLIKNQLGPPDNFEKIVFQLLDTAPGISNLQLAPKGIINAIVPLKGNEKAIGHNLLADDARNKEAIYAKETKQLTLAGPFTLIQGGVAVIARQPVFLTSPEGKTSFWGFTSALMILDNLLNQSRISTLESKNYSWTLERLHPDTQAIDTFARSSSSLVGAPVIHQVLVPNSTWELNITPKAGWIAIKSATVDGILLMAITVVISLLIYNGLRHPMVLAQELEVRTRHLNQDRLLLKQTQRELKESQERLEMAVSGAELGLWDVNLQTGKAIFNPQWAEMLGYNLDELEQSLEQWQQLVHPDDLPAMTLKLDAHISGKSKNYQGDIRMRSKSGEWKWI